MQITSLSTFSLTAWLRETMLPLASTPEDNARELSSLAFIVAPTLYPVLYKEDSQGAKNKALRQLCALFSGLRLRATLDDRWSRQGALVLVRCNGPRGRCLAWLPLTEVEAAEKQPQQ